jgi:hypothetical protein
MDYSVDIFIIVFVNHIVLEHEDDIKDNAEHTEEELGDIETA